MAFANEGLIAPITDEDDESGALSATLTNDLFLCSVVCLVDLFIFDAVFRYGSFLFHNIV